MMGPEDPPLEPREELAAIAASLRAYLEQQVECGSSGIPRLARRPAAPAPQVTAAPAETPTEPSCESPDEAPQASAGEPEPTRASAAAVTPIARVEELVVPPPPVRPVSTPPPAAAPPRPLPVIQAEVASCTRCVLAETRTNTVFQRGNPAAKLCFVGEAPGADEDAQGLPFVGLAGQLLDKMIQAMGLDPEKDVYVCNIIKCRPPENRKPEAAETATCIPYLHEQLASIEPKVIVALGNTSVAALLGTKLGITKVRGSWKLYRGKIMVMPTFHPSYLLRPGAAQAEAKRQTWEDLQAVMKELGLSKPGRA